MKAWIVLLALVLGGCGHVIPDLTIEGRAVEEVESADTLKHCERVGPMTTQHGGADKATNALIAKRSLLNRAGLTKSTHVASVLKLSQGSSSCGADCVEVQAVAFRCQTKVVVLDPNAL